MTSKNSTATAVNATNGKTPQNETPKAENNASTPGQTPKVQSIPTPELPPLEDRILKVNQLVSYVDKYEALEETEEKLKKFKLSTDGSRDTLRISDSRGNEFQTTNSGVIADVLETIKASVAAKKAEVEKQIQF